MNRSHAFSHGTAAQLYGIPLPLYARSSDLEVSACRPLRSPRRAGVSGYDVDAAVWRAHELIVPRDGRGELIDIPVVSPALMWAQLAEVLDLRDLVAVADSIVTMQHPGAERFGPLGTIDELRAITAAWTGRRGALACKKAIEHVRVGPLSRPESLVRLMVVEAGLPHPQVNSTVCDLTGAPIAMADLVWHEYRNLLEYEGDGHRSSKGKFRSDIERFGLFADAKWSAHRANGDHVFIDPNRILARVGRSLAEAGWSPPRGGLHFVSPARY